MRSISYFFILATLVSPHCSIKYQHRAKLATTISEKAKISADENFLCVGYPITLCFEYSRILQLAFYTMFSFGLVVVTLDGYFTPDSAHSTAVID